MWADPHTGTETHDNICAIMVPYPLFTCARTHGKCEEEEKHGGMAEVFFFFFWSTGERLPARRASEMYLIRQLWSHQLNREKKDIISKTFIIFFFFGTRVIPTIKPVIYSPLRRKYETASHQIQAVLINAFQRASSLPAVRYLLSWVHRVAAVLLHCAAAAAAAAARVALLHGGKKTVHSLTNQSQSNVLCSLHVHCQRKAHFLHRCFTLKRPPVAQQV